MSYVVTILQHTTALGPLWVVLLTLVGLPIANEIVQRAKGSTPTSLITKAQSALQLIASGFLSIPAVGAIIAKFPVVGDLLYLFAPTDKTALPKPLSKMLLDARAAKKANDKTPPTGSPPVTPAALVLFLIGATMLQGCALPKPSACVNPIPALVAKCTFENNLIACGETTGLDLVPIIADIVMSAIGGTFNSATLVAELESEGYSKAAPCILAAIEGYLMPVAPQIAAKVHEALVYKLTKDGKHGIVDVKTKSGYVAHCVLK